MPNLHISIKCNELQNKYESEELFVRSGAGNKTQLKLQPRNCYDYNILRNDSTRRGAFLLYHSAPNRPI